MMRQGLSGSHSVVAALAGVACAASALGGVEYSVRKIAHPLGPPYPVV